MRLTETHLAAIAGRPPNANMRSIIAALAQAGIGTGLNRPHRLAHFIAQIAHESGAFRWDAEIWTPGKPTKAQARYERDFSQPWTASDPRNGLAFRLGNSQKGDGYRFRGRGPIQLTGRGSVREFTGWAKRMVPGAPDFEANPDLLNTDPWEGLSAVWYWDTRNINDLADRNDIRAVTKRINGGYNGLDDRMRYYTRAALVLLGYQPDNVQVFQTAAGLTADGIAGPQTRAALDKRLGMAPLVEFGAAPEPTPKAPPVMPRPMPTPPADPDATIIRPAAVIGVVLLILAILVFSGAIK